MFRPSLIFCSCLTIALSGCSKPEPSAPQATSTPVSSASPGAPADEPIDACSLLTREEIEAAVGAALVEAKGERKEADGLVISQCYFALPDVVDSMNLRLVQRGKGADARSPRQVWQETFARDLEAALEKRKGPPQAVSGVGDEAFWMGGPKSGGLYVLKGDRYFRLGVGGEPNQETKIEKAKKLAAAILSKW